MTGQPTLRMLLKLFHLPAFVANYEDWPERQQKKA